MFRLRRDVKIFIIVLTILFSVYLGINRSNLDKVFVHSEIKLDIRQAENIYNDSHNNKKIRFDYEIDDLAKINSLIAEINTIESSNILYSEIKNKYSLVIVELPVEISRDILTRFRMLNGLANESIIRKGVITESTDLKENLNNNFITKKRIQNLINESVSPETIERFREQLEIIQAKIDSLGSRNDIRKHNASNELIMIKAVKTSSGNTALRRSMIVFSITTLVSIIFLILGLIIAYYIFVLMYKLMLLLGIRTSRGDSSNYNYNKKSYGRSKKVKRIYKDRNKTNENTDEKQ
ncbi:MAG: hypothetical protein K9N07_00705 [Candidatus Cloacimonetes bacterium]|nr:hypothetical protein [Candidatus Cloacimonadota bacterium]